MPSNQDFISGYDPTSSGNISQSQLLAMVQQGSPFTDKGLILMTQDVLGVPVVPDAGATTKWQNYIWLRVGAAAVTPYIWNAASPNPTGTLLFWNSIAQSTIGPGTIVGSMIADFTIPDSKIISLDGSKITGTLPPSVVAQFITTGSAAGGDLTGTYPNPSVAASAITAAKIALATITGAQVAANTIAFGNMLGDGVLGDMMRSKANSTVEWFTPKQITTGLADPDAGGANDGEMIGVNSGAAGTFKYYKSVVQKQFTSLATPTSSTGTAVLASITAAPNYNATGMNALSGLDTPFVPVLTNNKVHIHCVIPVYSISAATLFVGLYNATGATAPLAGTAAVMNALQGSNLVIDWEITNCAAQTFYLGFGGTSATATNMKINSTDGTNNWFASTKTTMTIEERAV